MVCLAHIHNLSSLVWGNESQDAELLLNDHLLRLGSAITELIAVGQCSGEAMAVATSLCLMDTIIVLLCRRLHRRRGRSGGSRDCERMLRFPWLRGRDPCGCPPTQWRGDRRSECR